MSKNKAFIITAIVLGAIGLALVVFAGIVFLTGQSSIYSDIAKYTGLAKASVTTATVCRAAVLFEAAAFLFGCTAYPADE